MTPYSIIKTKAGRAKVINQIEALCADRNLQLLVEHEDARTVYIKINRGNHYVSFHLEPDVLPDDCVISWFTRGDARFPPTFYGGDVNKFHFGKATSVVSDVEKLIDTIRNGYDQLKCIESLHLLDMSDKEQAA